MTVEDEEKQRHIHLMEEKKEKKELEGLKNLINVLLVHMMLYIRECLEDEINQHDFILY